jgi:hypothetical protein
MTGKYLAGAFALSHQIRCTKQRGSEGLRTSGKFGFLMVCNSSWN